MRAWSASRTSVGLVAASGAVAAFVLMNRGAPWRGSMAWTIDYALGATVLTGPLTAAAAAYRSAAERRRAMLYESTPRGWLVPARTALWATKCAVTAYGIALVASLFVTLSVPHGGSPPWAIVLVGPVLLAWYAALGALTGRLVPHLITAPATAVLAFAIGLMGAIGIGPNVLRHGPATGSLSGVTWDRSVLLGQVAVIAGLAVVMVVAALGSIPSRPWWSAVSGLVGIVACAVGFASLESTGDESFVPSNETASACAGSRPTVCVAPSDRIVLESLSSQMGRVALALYDVRAEVPTRFNALLPSAHPPPDDGFFALTGDAADPSTSVSEAARALTTPGACSAWWSPISPGWRAFSVTTVLQGWLMQRAGVKQLGGLGLRHRTEAWLADSSPLQDAWVRSTYTALRVCEFDRLRVPWRAQ